MKNFTINNEQDYFDELFGNRPIKMFMIAFSSLSLLLSIPVIYGIIWFERFGCDMKRIFINRLVSSVCWSFFAWILFAQIPDMIRYFSRPFSESICFFILATKTMIAMQVILFFNAMNISRYIFIFWLKNPLNFQDDFWSTFVNLWIVSFSLVSQFVYVFLPGKQALNFYICSGSFEAKLYYKLPKKFNWSTSIMQLWSIILHLYVNIRVKRHKKINQVTSFQQQEIQSREKQNITDIVTTACNLTLMGLSSIIVLSFNRISPEQANLYPYYLIVYLFHLVVPFIISNSISLMYYIRQPQMRKTLWRELNNQFGWHHNPSQNL